MSNKLIERLTNQQMAALSIDHQRWLAVEAGAGAGKTRVLATRMVLLLEAGEALDSIVAITFTRKAARELASRVQSMIGARIKELTANGDNPQALANLRKAEENFHHNRIGTIDSFCRVNLAKHALDAGVEPGFGQLDEIRTARKRRHFTTSFGREMSELASRRAELMDAEEIARAEAWIGLNRWLESYKIESLINLVTNDTLELPRAFAAWNGFAEVSDCEGYVAEMKRVGKEAVQEAIKGPLWDDMQDMLKDARLVLKDTPSDVKALWIIEMVGECEKGNLSFDSLQMPRGGKTKGCYESLSGGSKRVTEIKNELVKLLTLYAVDETVESYSLEALRHFATLQPFILEEWNKQLGAFLTFADLKSKLFTFVQSDAGRDAVAQDIRWMMIDEFQDTDEVQWQLFARILAASKANLFIVGDDKQSIYRFRGAKVAVFRRARREVAAHNEHTGAAYWPKHPLTGADLPREDSSLATKLLDSAKHGIVTLSANFRTLSCPLSIGNIAFGNVFGLQNPAGEPLRARAEIDPEPAAMDLGLIQEQGSGSVVILPIAKGEKVSRDDERDSEGGQEYTPSYLLPDDRNEALYLVEHIRDDLMASRGFTFGQIAILARTQKHISLLASVLADAKMPFTLTGGNGLYGAQETLDFWALAAAVATPNDNYAMTAFLRSALGGISDNTLALLVRDNKGRKLKSSFKSLWRLMQEESKWSADIDDSQRIVLASLLGLMNALSERAGTLPFPSLLESALLSLGAFGQDWSTAALQRNANLRQNISLARDWFNEFGNDLAAFAEDMRVAIDGGEKAAFGVIDGHDDTIQLMTIHQSKGKEFDAVILPFLSEREINDYPAFDYSFDVGNACGLEGKPVLGMKVGNWHDAMLESGAKPLSLGIIGDRSRAEALAESRRLLYVAWTRAAQHLTVTLRLSAKGKDVDDPADFTPPTPESGGMKSDLCASLGLPVDAKCYRADNLEQVRETLIANGVSAEIEITPLYEPSPLDLKDDPEVGARGLQVDAFIEKQGTLRLDPAVLALATPIETASPSPWWKVESADDAEPAIPPAMLHSVSFGRVRRKGEGLSPAERGTIVHALLESAVRERNRQPASFEIAALANELGIPAKLIEAALPELRSEAERGAKTLWSNGFPAREFTEITLPHAGEFGLHAPRLDYLAMTKAGHWRIVDFKTGDFDESYLEQVANYARALAMRLDALGESWTRIEGELLFTASGELRSVGVWSEEDLAAKV